MKKQIVHVTSNTRKFNEVTDALAIHGLEPISAKDIFSDWRHEESGATAEDRAYDKAIAFANEAIMRCDPIVGRAVILADGTSLMISGLGGEPGANIDKLTTRRIRDRNIKRDSDDIFEILLDEKMKLLLDSRRKALFTSVLCAISLSGSGTIEKIISSVGMLNGSIRYSKPEPGTVIPELPLDSVFQIPEANNILLSELRQMSPGKRAMMPRTHLEMAVENAVPDIIEMMSA